MERLYPVSGLFDGVAYCGGDGDTKIVSSDHVFVLTNEAMDERISVIVRRGYPFNGANLPRCLWLFFGHPYESPRDCAALLHDAMYDEQFTSRREADRLYRVCLGELGYGAFERWTEWFFIRLFGWLAWRRSNPSRHLDVRFARKD